LLSGSEDLFIAYGSGTVSDVTSNGTSDVFIFEASSSGVIVTPLQFGGSGAEQGGSAGGWLMGGSAIYTDGTLTYLSACGFSSSNLNGYRNQGSNDFVTFTYSIPNAVVLGDPMISNFYSENFQVHGEHGRVYSLLSSVSLNVNTRFGFLDLD
jgi:hypothetical protein